MLVLHLTQINLKLKMMNVISHGLQIKLGHHQAKIKGFQIIFWLHLHEK